MCIADGKGGRRDGKGNGGKTGREEKWVGRKEERGKKGMKGWRKETKGGLGNKGREQGYQLTVHY